MLVKKFTLLCLAISIFHTSVFSEEWKSLFDGESLKGWNGKPAFWLVKDGAITGTNTRENATKGNTFIIYTGDDKDKNPIEFGDFHLKMEFRMLGVGGNSGIQYRSFVNDGVNDGWRVAGYQFDMSTSKAHTSSNHGEKCRGSLGARGKKTTITGSEIIDTKRGKRHVAIKDVVAFGDSRELLKVIKGHPEWNTIEIIAKGYYLVHKINGQIVCGVIDLDKENRREKGLLAIQLHAGPPMIIQVKNIQIKKEAK